MSTSVKNSQITIITSKMGTTTEIYMHVSNMDIGKIKSPFDILWRKGGDND